MKYTLKPVKTKKKDTNNNSLWKNFDSLLLN